MSPPPIQRLKYFTGQFLEKDDFIDEQNYHVDMRQRGNRALYFSAGILDDGFQVERVIGEPRQIRVTAGTAVDAKGQELVVLDQLLSTTPIPASDGQRYLIALAYHQFEDRQQATGDVNLTDTTRYVELPELKWYLDTDTFDRGLWVVVAAVRVNLDGSISAIDLGRGVRAYAGARVPGRLGVGTSVPQQVLSVTGGLNIDQGDANDGTLNSGAISFGSNSGEGIASTRASNAPNQWGLDFYTRHGSVRMSIANDGKVGIGTTAPNARLSVVVDGENELAGVAASGAFRVAAGNLAAAAGTELGLASIGFNSGHHSSLGIRARRVSDGLGWESAAVGLGLDWNNTVRVNDASLWLHPTGRVGIGTSSPLSALNIPAAGLQLGFSAAASDNFHLTSDMHDNRRGLRLWNGNYGSGSHILTAAADGKVGIGTTTPLAQLQVVGGAIMPAAGNSESSGIMFPGNPGTGSGDAAWIRYYARTGERTALEIGVSNDKLSDPDHQDDILLMPSGGVGIGTTAPHARLSVVVDGENELAGVAASGAFRVVAGNLAAAAGTELGLASIGFNSGHHSSLGIRARRVSDGLGWESAAIGLGLDWNNTIRVNDASLWLHPTGRVGISTSTPDAKLHVNGAGGQSVDLLVNGRLKSDNNDGGLCIASDRFVGGLDPDKVGFYSGNAWRLTVAANGNVGIGTTAPASKLHIVDQVDTTTYPHLESEFPNAGGKFIQFSRTQLWGLTDCYGIMCNWDSDQIFFGLKNEGPNRKDAVLAWGDDTNDSLRFMFATPNVTPPAEYMRITGDGKVGIGTNTPTDRLHVKGDSKLEGDAGVTGSLSVTGTISGQGSFVPGMIIMWSGALNQIPKGWALCDGTNSTPDLRGRFVVGHAPGDASFGTLKGSGGSATTSLTVSNMPAHSHSATTGDALPSSNFTHGTVTASNSGTTELGIAIGNHRNDTASLKFAHTHSLTTSSVGSGTAFSVLPPYFVLAYLMYRG